MVMITLTVAVTEVETVPVMSAVKLIVIVT